MFLCGTILAMNYWNKMFEGSILNMRTIIVSFLVRNENNYSWKK